MVDRGFHGVLVVGKDKIKKMVWGMRMAGEGRWSIRQVVWRGMEIRRCEARVLDGFLSHQEW